MANDAAGCPWRSSCKSPRTLQKCKLLITKQLTFGTVLGEHKLSSPSTRLKVNHLCIRCLCFESVRGDLHEGHFSLPDANFPSSRAQKPRFCAREAEFVRLVPGNSPSVTESTLPATRKRPLATKNKPRWPPETNRLVSKKSAGAPRWSAGRPLCK